MVLIRILYTILELKSRIVLDCGGWVRDCIYIFGVVWGEARGGIRGEYGESFGVGRCDRVYGRDLSVED